MDDGYMNLFLLLWFIYNYISCKITKSIVEIKNKKKKEAENYVCNINRARDVEDYNNLINGRPRREIESIDLDPVIEYK